jgi:hypothetical protein
MGLIRVIRIGGGPPSHAAVDAMRDPALQKST